MTEYAKSSHGGTWGIAAVIPKYLSPRLTRILAVLTDAAFAHDISRNMFAHLAITIDVVEGRLQLQNLSFHNFFIYWKAKVQRNPDNPIRPPGFYELFADGLTKLLCLQSLTE